MKKVLAVVFIATTVVFLAACDLSANNGGVTGSSKSSGSSTMTEAVSDPIIGVWEFEGLAEHGGAASAEELEAMGINIELNLEIKADATVLMTAKDGSTFKGKWNVKGDNYSIMLSGEEITVKLLEGEELFMESDGQQLVFQKVSE